MLICQFTIQFCLPGRFFSMSVLTFLVRFILGKIAGCAYIKLIQYFCGALDFNITMIYSVGDLCQMLVQTLHI